MNDFDLKAKIMRILYYYEVRKDGPQQGKAGSLKTKAADFANHILKYFCCAGPMGRDVSVQREEDFRPSRASLLRSAQQLLEKKRCDLDAVVGERVGRSLYEAYVQQWDYVLMYSPADREQGLSVRRALEKTQFRVAGPWCIGLGSCRIPTWERLLSSATVVVVLVSRALHQERLLNVCFAEVLSTGVRVVPMLLEEMDEAEVSSELRAIMMRQEVPLFGRDVETAVGEVARHTLAHERYFRELDHIDGLLRSLLQDFGAETPK